MEFQDVLSKKMSNLGYKNKMGECNEMHIIFKPVNNHYNDVHSLRLRQTIYKIYTYCKPRLIKNLLRVNTHTLTKDYMAKILHFRDAKDTFASFGIQY